MIKANQADKNNAIAKASEEQDELLPDGEKTQNHHIFTINDSVNENIGYIWFGVEKRNGEDMAFLFDVKINNDFQGFGYGKEAMKEIETEVKMLGLNKIQLHTLNENIKARNMYYKLGYKKIRDVQNGEILEKCI